MPRHVEVARAIRRSGSPVAHLVTESGEAFSLQFTPEEADISGVGWKIGQQERQGRRPLSRRESQQLMSMSFTHIISDRMIKEEAGWSANAAVRELIDLANSGRKVRLINVSDDIETRGWWWPSLSVRITRRSVDQQIRQAQMSWTFLEESDERPAIARVPPPPPPPPKASTPEGGGQKDYTVVKGDSLWAIASRLLGKGERWREIYDLNKDRLNLKPPEMYRGLLTVWIYPGQVMKIPAR